MFKNKENIIIVLLIALILGNSFMSYRNFMIAREADRIARAEYLTIQQHADYFNALIYLGVLPTASDLDKAVNQKQAQLQNKK